MYANLRVTSADQEWDFFAWQIEVTEDETIIHLDANDGDSNYAVPNGTKVIPRHNAPKLVITADF